MMIAEEYLGRSRLFRRLKSGPDGQLVEVYAARSPKTGSLVTAHGGASTWSVIS
jgi:hypothetical protein